jgi:hypothetical protein
MEEWKGAALEHSSTPTLHHSIPPFLRIYLEDSLTINSGS